MCVDLGSGDAGMSQHFLYGPQIGAAFYQMCCKGVPDSMRGNSFFDPGFCLPIKLHLPRTF